MKVNTTLKVFSAFVNTLPVLRNAVVVARFAAVVVGVGSSDLTERGSLSMFEDNWCYCNGGLTAQRRFQ